MHRGQAWLLPACCVTHARTHVRALSPEVAATTSTSATTTTCSWSTPTQPAKATILVAHTLPRATLLCGRAGSLRRS